MKYQVVFEIACDVEASSKDEAIDTAWNELEQRMKQLPGWYMTSGVYAEDIEEDMCNELLCRPALSGRADFVESTVGGIPGAS